MAKASTAASSAPSGPRILRAMVTARGKQARNHSSYSASASCVVSAIMPTKGVERQRRLTRILKVGGAACRSGGSPRSLARRNPADRQGSQEPGSDLLLEEMGVGDGLP